MMGCQMVVDKMVSMKLVNQKKSGCVFSMVMTGQRMGARVPSGRALILSGR